MKRTERAVFAVIILLAAIIRISNLSWTPAGISLEEAVIGNRAVATLADGTFTRDIFGDMQALAVYAFGTTPGAVRTVPALAGIATVIGVYLLARRLFDDWRMAAIAAFLLATGFWHVYASRIGLVDALAPLCAVWGFYQLYKGIETHRLWHWALSGFWFGLGFYTVISYRVIPLAIALTLLAYWLAVRTVFHHEKYLFARHQMLGGAALMISVLIFMLLPTLGQFYAQPLWLVTSWHALGTNITRLLTALFTDPQIMFWPIAAFFALGLGRTLWRFVHAWRTHRHPGVAHTLLLSWFFVGILPAIATVQPTLTPLSLILIAPAVAILAAAGMHWMVLWLERWYHQTDRVVVLALVALLLAVGVADLHRYFVQWAQDEATLIAFNARSVQVAQRLGQLPPATMKYVVVGMTSTQPLMFLTNTSTPAQQNAQHIFYLTQKQFRAHQYQTGAVVLQLDP